MSISIDKDKCIGCGKCRNVCPGTLIKMDENKKAYIKYGKHTFKLTSKTKYYFSGGEAPNEYCSKSAFMSTMRSMNGLGLCIKVTNGKVVEMSFNS